MSKYPEIIDVEQLRAEIGGVTKNPQFAQHVSDEQLQAIIDRHTEWMESQAHQRLQEGKAKPVKQVEPVEISLTNKSSLPNYAVGELKYEYFPYATEGVITKPNEYEGQSLDYEPDLSRKSQKLFHTAYMFDIEDRDVLVVPSDVDKVTLFCPPLNVATREIMADMIGDVNQNIITYAKQMVQERTKEFAEPAYPGGGGGPIAGND